MIHQNYDHTIDTVTFMLRPTPQRREAVADFFEDRNAPSNFYVEVDEISMSKIHGGCGMRPDLNAESNDEKEEELRLKRIRDTAVKREMRERKLEADARQYVHSRYIRNRPTFIPKMTASEAKFFRRRVEHWKKLTKHWKREWEFKKPEKKPESPRILSKHYFDTAGMSTGTTFGGCPKCWIVLDIDDLSKTCKKCGGQIFDYTVRPNK